MLEIDVLIEEGAMADESVPQDPDNSIRNCRFGYRCHMTWATLAPTGDPGVRYCDKCQENVIMCRSDRQLAAAIAGRQCVAIPADLITHHSHEAVSPEFHLSVSRRELVGRPVFEPPDPEETRRECAQVWRASAQMTRQLIFGDGDPLRPEYAAGNPLAAEIDIPAVGMVGPGYVKGGIAIVILNPPGGSPDSPYLSSAGEIYRAIVALRAVVDRRTVPMAEFEAVNAAYLRSIPEWDIWKLLLEPLLDAAAVTASDIAYLNVVPFRTCGQDYDQPAADVKAFCRRGYLV